MSDGNTITNLDPVGLESDMKPVFDLFAKASNAIVERSNLAKEVAAMRTELDQLRDAYAIERQAKEDAEQRLAGTTEQLNYHKELEAEAFKDNQAKAKRISELETEANERKAAIAKAMGIVEAPEPEPVKVPEAAPEPIINPPASWATAALHHGDPTPQAKPPEPVVEHWPEPKQHQHIENEQLRDYDF